ncbi:putative membrane transporter [Blattamonas nauphoetae]|uniref:Glycerophosphocholine acyltransferase 1 n=1 Tax=Blattamonas nauphoetae TaxID=2049346 RepID=A0ABQ9XWK5_9EUKA|nr:putative membrane transporter [Blattamonas nauphoetae]
MSRRRQTKNSNRDDLQPELSPLNHDHKPHSRLFDISAFERKQRTQKNGRVRRFRNPLKRISSKHITLMEKCSFMGSIVLILLTEYIVTNYTRFLPLFYTVVQLSLIFFRIFYYKKLGCHFYILDYCYFANFMLMLFLWFFPRNVMLFEICFIACNGSLLVAIITWRNSLVLHDIDRMTSSFLHCFPGLVTYCLRWKDTGYAAVTNQTPQNIVRAFFLNMDVFTVWMLAYFIKVIVVDGDYLDDNPAFDYSERWITKRLPVGSFLWRLYNEGPDNRYYKGGMFLLCQLLYTIGSSLPSYLLIYSRHAHFFALLAMYLVCTWNGASFYLSRVVHKPVKKTEKKEEKAEDPFATTDDKSMPEGSTSGGTDLRVVSFFEPKVQSAEETTDYENTSSSKMAIFTGKPFSFMTEPSGQSYSDLSSNTDPRFKGKGNDVEEDKLLEMLAQKLERDRLGRMVSVQIQTDFDDIST